MYYFHSCSDVSNCPQRTSKVTSVNNRTGPMDGEGSASFLLMVGKYSADWPESAVTLRSTLPVGAHSRSSISFGICPALFSSLVPV
jgi:hypothetical protein